MTGTFVPPQTIGSVLCCLCGVSMQPNAANRCLRCLQSTCDITEGLQKRMTIVHCPECNSYLQPPKTWVRAELESTELLYFCVNRLKDLKKVTVVDYGFVWTEPHSKRIKVRLRIRRDVLDGVTLEQAYVVEYTQHERMCESCTRSQANPDQWEAVVQVRQHVSHRRTFFYLEQLILKHGAALRAINIKEMREGIDFFFGHRSHAQKFVDFLGSVVPINREESKRLVSHDRKSNIYNHKHAFSVEICEICREDLICLPPKVSATLGNLGPLVLCMKVSDNLLLMDPFTLRSEYVDATRYWRNPFKPLLNSRQLVEYIVYNEANGREVMVRGTKYCLGYAEVARASDPCNIFTVKTHLGHLLREGDTFLGYDLYAANINDDQVGKHKRLILPDAILVKKSYRENYQRKMGRSRQWKLKNLDMEIDNSRGRTGEERRDREYEEFLKDLEENPELRFNISLYRNKDYQQSEMASTDGGDNPSVPLEELLADLDLSEEDLSDDHMEG